MKAVKKEKPAKNNSQRSCRIILDFVSALYYVLNPKK
jgi:hypothetical protein